MKTYKYITWEAGLEPTTAGFGDQYSSIELPPTEGMGFEPMVLKKYNTLAKYRSRPLSDPSITN